MRRRSLLDALGSGLGVAAGIAAAGSVGTAGCLEGLGSAGASPPATRVSDPPAGVYRPAAAPEQALVGTAHVGDLQVAVMYGPPVRFWEVVGEQTYRRGVEPEDAVHLSALAWHPESGVVLPEIGLTVEVARDGEVLAHEAVYAMVSQRMGFHYGDNFALDGDGAYDVTVSLGGLQLRRTGAFAGRFDDPASHTFTFEYAASERDALDVTHPDSAGDSGAISPALPDGVPVATAPVARASAVDASPDRDEGGVPGEVIGRPTAADVVFDVRALTGDDATDRLSSDTAAGGDHAYLAVTPHTPHNGLVLPNMGLRLVVDGSTQTGFDGILDRTVDPELGYHHGLAIPRARLDDASTLALETLTPPQVARHAGYETAFLDVPRVSVAD
jgi:hypothetical protein